MTDPNGARFKFFHLSDLHFGRIDGPALQALKNYFQEEGLGTDNAKRPASRCGILISGDITQRARKEQFEAASRFLDDLGPLIKVAVPGNHDVPLFNLFQRLWHPFRAYERYVIPHAPMQYADDDIAIFGLRSPDPFTVAEGRVFPQEVRAAGGFFRSSQAHKKLRILIAHHPLHKKAKSCPHWETLMQLRPHLILVGHEHLGAADLLEHHSRSTAVITAGTGFSTRLRSGPNSFNVIDIKGREIKVQIMRLEKPGPRAHPCFRPHANVEFTASG